MRRATSLGGRATDGGPASGGGGGIAFVGGGGKPEDEVWLGLLSDMLIGEKRTEGRGGSSSGTIPAFASSSLRRPSMRRYCQSHLNVRSIAGGICVVL